MSTSDFVGVAFYMLALLGMLTTPLLCLWLATLAFSPSLRVWVRLHPKAHWGLLGGLGVPALVCVPLVVSHWLERRASDLAWEARHSTLARDQVVAGVAMPSGTRLHSVKPQDAESFETADFPVPTAVAGVLVRQMSRTVRGGWGEEPLRVEDTFTVTLAADQEVQGWRCSMDEWVTFKTDPQGDSPTLSACQLAAGNQVGPWQVPAGAMMLAESHRLDPSVRWRLRVSASGAPSEPMRMLGMSLARADLDLDAQRGFLALTEGVLAEDWSLGEIRHPAGVLVSTVSDKVKKRYPRAWLALSPARGQRVHHPGHEDLVFGFTMLQDPRGRVLAVLPNTQAGAFYMGFQ
jgi:hypothetical protein